MTLEVKEPLKLHIKFGEDISIGSPMPKTTEGGHFDLGEKFDLRGQKSQNEMCA